MRTTSTHSAPNAHVSAPIDDDGPSKSQAAQAHQSQAVAKDPQEFRANALHPGSSARSSAVNTLKEMMGGDTFGAHQWLDKAAAVSQQSGADVLKLNPGAATFELASSRDKTSFGEQPLSSMEDLARKLTDPPQGQVALDSQALKSEGAGREQALQQLVDALGTDRKGAEQWMVKAEEAARLLGSDTLAIDPKNSAFELKNAADKGKTSGPQKLESIDDLLSEVATAMAFEQEKSERKQALAAHIEKFNDGTDQAQPGNILSDVTTAEGSDLAAMDTDIQGAMGPENSGPSPDPTRPETEHASNPFAVSLYGIEAKAKWLGGIVQHGLVLNTGPAHQEIDVSDPKTKWLFNARVTPLKIELGEIADVLGGVPSPQLHLDMGVATEIKLLDEKKKFNPSIKPEGAYYNPRLELASGAPFGENPAGIGHGVPVGTLVASGIEGYKKWEETGDMGEALNAGYQQARKTLPIQAAAWGAGFGMAKLGEAMGVPGAQVVNATFANPNGQKTNPLGHGGEYRLDTTSDENKDKAQRLGLGAYDVGSAQIGIIPIVNTANFELNALGVTFTGGGINQEKKSDVVNESFIAQDVLNIADYMRQDDPQYFTDDKLKAMIEQSIDRVKRNNGAGVKEDQRDKILQEVKTQMPRTPASNDVVDNAVKEAVEILNEIPPDQRLERLSKIVGNPLDAAIRKAEKASGQNLMDFQKQQVESDMRQQMGLPTHSPAHEAQAPKPAANEPQTVPLNAYENNVSQNALQQIQNAHTLSQQYPDAGFDQGLIDLLIQESVNLANLDKAPEDRIDGDAAQRIRQAAWGQVADSFGMAPPADVAARPIPSANMEPSADAAPSADLGSWVPTESSDLSDLGSPYQYQSSLADSSDLSDLGSPYDHGPAENLFTTADTSDLSDNSALFGESLASEPWSLEPLVDGDQALDRLGDMQAPQNRSLPGEQASVYSRVADALAQGAAQLRAQAQAAPMAGDDPGLRSVDDILNNGSSQNAGGIDRSVNDPAPSTTPTPSPSPISNAGDSGDSSARSLGGGGGGVKKSAESETRIGAGDGNLTGKYGSDDPQLAGEAQWSHGDYSATAEGAAGADAGYRNDVDADGHRQIEASANAGVGGKVSAGYEDENGNFARGEAAGNVSAGASVSSTRNAETGIRDTSAGVAANASANATASWGTENGSTSATLGAEAEAGAEGGVRTNDDGDVIGVHGKVGAEVGVDGEVSNTVTNDKGSSETGISAGVGFGASADGEFGMNQEGNFVIGGEVEGAFIGKLGLSAKMEFDIDEYEKQAEDIDNRWHNGDKWGAVTETGDMLLDSAEKIPLAGGFIAGGRDAVGGFVDSADNFAKGDFKGGFEDIGEGLLDGAEDIPGIGGAVKKLREDGFMKTAMDAGEAVTDGLEKVGDKISEGAEKVGEGVKDVAEDVGEGIKDGAEAVGEGIKDGAEAVGDGIKDGFKAIGGLFS